MNREQLLDKLVRLRSQGVGDPRTGTDMAGPGLRIESDLAVGLPWPALDEELLRAAALAAVLVDYRRRARRQRKDSGLQGAGANWRMVRRWAQLGGGR